MAGSPPQPGPGGPTRRGQDEGVAHLSSLYPGDPRHSPRGSWASAERGGRAAGPWEPRAGCQLSGEMRGARGVGGGWQVWALVLVPGRV